MTGGSEDRKPSALVKAVEILRAMHSEEEFAAWAAEPLSEALWKSHFQAGLWIRNEWVYEDPAPLVDRIQRLAAPVHPDSISEYVLEALWRVLNGEACPTIEELLERRHPGCSRGIESDA